MRLVVLGGGESGYGAAVLGHKIGYDVFLSDSGAIKDIYKQGLIERNIDWEDCKHTEELILNADLVVKSPGIPDKAHIIKKILEKKISFISEIEFAAQFTDAQIIGITGSNGKTTTTMLTYHILQNAGLNVGMAGNIGKSFALQVAENDFNIYVLELSSFQLDGIMNFCPHIAIITNITPDHLDRYDYKMENYIESKFKIIKNQTENEYLIYDADDKNINDWIKKNIKNINTKLIPFSLTKTFKEGAYLKQNFMEVLIDNRGFEIDVTEISLDGLHNYKNAMAATAAARIMQIRKTTIRESLGDFEGANHRLEKVLKIKKVQYINDSKATNVNSTFYALESMTSPIIWIVGGVDKGNDYSQLMSLVREKVKAIICLGVDNQKIKEYFEDVVDIFTETVSMEEAVKLSQRIAESGDVVLLSPACSSFDLFIDYEDRGDQFKRAVRNL